MWASENRPERALRLEERRQGRQRVAGFERRPEPDLVVGEERDDRGQDAERQQDPGRSRSGRATEAM